MSRAHDVAAAALYPKVDRAVVSLLSKAGWSWGYVLTIDSSGRTICIADAHRGDGKRFLASFILDNSLSPGLIKDFGRQVS